MKKYLFIFFFAIFTIFVIFFGHSAYNYYVALHADDPIDPYLQVELGNATVVRGSTSFDIEKEGVFTLLENDSIVTYTGSESTIFWPDRSITQLGENSKFHIHKMQVASDYSKIEIEASLLQGKVYSSIVRTLYPDSFLNIKIPTQNTVAGVRGTEFSINLDRGYIHSVDHSISLENTNFNIFGNNSAIILPGEIVSAKNILEKLTKDVLDTAWEYSSTLKNNNYITEHSKIIQNSWDKISGELGKNNYWDMFVRKILSYFDMFKELELAKKINSFDIAKTSEIPKEFLLKWYQKFKIGDFAEERDLLRGLLYKISEADVELQKILNILATESLWDKLKFPTIDLNYSQKILQDYSNKTSLTIDNIVNNLSTKNYTEEIKNNISNWFRN